MENTKNIKIIVALFAFGILYILIIFVLRGTEKINSGYIINSNIAGFFCKNTNCEKADVIKYQEKKFKIYQNNNFIGEYQLENLDNVWNFYQDNKWQSVHGNFLAIESELPHEIIKYQINSMTKEDIDQILSLLKKNNITSTKGEFDNTYVYVADLDENGEMDRIISISNQAEAVNKKTYFSGVFINLNGEWLNPILEQETGIEKYTIPFFDIAALLKINNETKLILNRSFYDNIDESTSIMLKFNKNKIEIEIAK